MPFITSPNLPQGRVTLAAVSSLAPQIQAALGARGIRCVSVPSCSTLDAPVQAHADMLCHPLGGESIVVEAGSFELASALRGEGFLPIMSNKCLSRGYPGDIALNAARIGSRLFAYINGLDEAIRFYCEESRINIIPVKQGYTKCSTVAADANSIITEDASIAGAAEREGLQVLRIRPGAVELPGYGCGFLGGCCGLLGPDVMAFTGSLQTHPDELVIRDFLNRRGIQVECLTNEPMLDIGGILPLIVNESQ